MKNFLAAFFYIGALTTYAQEELLNELEKTNENSTVYALQTFKGTRLVNGHSVETKPGGSLEFIISHRFGTINSGGYNLFGLDESTIRIGLEYGITDRLGIGVGRNSIDKTYDGYLKYKVLRQSKGVISMPVTMTLLGGTAIRTFKDAANEVHGTDRLSFVSQLLIARRFSSSFSFQVAPLYVHRNVVDETQAVHDLLAIGAGGRIKLTRSVSFHAEYYARVNEKSNNPNYDPIGLGFDIETGGHVFQLIFTNTLGMTERIMAAETRGDFFNGDIHFGFNITRTFQLSNKH